MKLFVRNLLTALFNKVTLSTILLQWLLIAAACYQRGYWAISIYHTDQGVLYFLVTLMNLPALFVAEPFLSPVNFWKPQADSFKDALVLIMTITAQWWIIGCAIWLVINHSKREKSNERIPTL